MSIEYRLDGNVAIVSLNRPDKLNAMTDEMYARVTELFTQFQSDDNVRAVIVTGAGRAFCSGSDVTSMVNTNLVAGRARMQTRHQMINAMYLPTLETQLEQENLCQGMAKLTEDHLEGVAAFKEKRAAKFTGR